MNVISNVTKIAVLRANALGDFIFVLPALQAIKETYKEAELVYLGRQWHEEFLNGRPGPIDRVIPIPKCDGMPGEFDKVENEKEVDLFFRQMQEEKFDIAFQMHGGGKHSNPFVINLKARNTVGLKTPDAVSLDRNIPYCVYHNEILRYLEVAGSVGARTLSLAPQINVIESDRRELEAVVSTKSPYIVLHPGVSSIRRMWPAEKFAQVADALGKKGYHLYITGSVDEKEISGMMLESMKLEAENLTGKLSLKALTALLSEASLLISNDTGPLHLARALDIPTMGLYLGVNMIMAGPVMAAKHRTCASWINNCPLCGISFSSDNFNNPTGKCKHKISFLTEIEVDEVVQYSLELIHI